MNGPHRTAGQAADQAAGQAATGNQFSPAAPIRVLVADDQTIVRKGTRALLEMIDDIEVVGEAVNGAEAIALAAALQPNVVLMDLMMPGVDGVAATERIVCENANVHVLALTSFGEDEKLLATVRAGALGFLLKDADTEALVAAIREVAQGHPWLPPVLAHRVLAQIGSSAPQPAMLEPLTDRELAVLKLLAQGQGNTQMALDLGITETTVRTHVSRILAKLGCENRVQAVIQALRLDLVSLGDYPAPPTPP